ncbi:MAG: ABC transporter permease subunit [Alphaproteobacteria bacterium]|nr:ABC transporter permease subunit [Alphaproteobacteria bacterium]
MNGRRLVSLLPWAWLGLFFLVPFLIVLKISLADADLGVPPYTALFEVVDDTVLRIRLNWANFQYVLTEELYAAAFLQSLKLASMATLACLLLGYPMAYAIARSSAAARGPLLMLIILPFWTSFLIRVYAWMAILKSEGPINHLLLALGLVDEPLPLLHSEFAVLIGLVYSYLPFMVLPLYANLEKMDLSLLEAAADLGCRPFRAFWAITVPQSWPGVVAGSMLVFIPAVGEFVIPDLLGGPETLMIGRRLWDDFFMGRDWPLAAAVAITLLVLLVLPMALLQHTRAGAER